MLYKYEDALLLEFKTNYFLTVYELVCTFYKRYQLSGDQILLDLKLYMTDQLSGGSLNVDEYYGLKNILQQFDNLDLTRNQDVLHSFYLTDIVAVTWTLITDSYWQNPQQIEQAKKLFVNKLITHHINLEKSKEPLSKQTIYSSIGPFCLDIFYQLGLAKNDEIISLLPNYIQKNISNFLKTECDAYRKSTPNDFLSYMESFLDELVKAFGDCCLEEDDSNYKTIDLKKVFKGLYLYLDDPSVLIENYEDLGALIDKITFNIPNLILKNINAEFLGIDHRLSSLNSLAEALLHIKVRDILNCIIKSIDPLHPYFNQQFLEQIINDQSFEDFFPEAKEYRLLLERSPLFTQKRKELAKLENELLGLKYLLENYLVSEILTSVSFSTNINSFLEVYSQKEELFNQLKTELEQIVSPLAGQEPLSVLVKNLPTNIAARIDRCSDRLKELRVLANYITKRNSRSFFATEFPVKFLTANGNENHIFTDNPESWAINFLRVAFLREHKRILLKDSAEIFRLIELLKQREPDFQNAVVAELSDLLRFHKTAIMSEQKFEVQNFMDLIFRQHHYDLKLFIRTEDIQNKFVRLFDLDTCKSALKIGNYNILQDSKKNQFSLWQDFFIKKLVPPTLNEGDIAIEKMVYFTLLTLFNNLTNHSEKKLLVNKTLYEFTDNLRWLCRIYLKPETNYDAQGKLIQILPVTLDLRNETLEQRAKYLTAHLAALTLTLSKMPEMFKECALTLYSQTESKTKVRSVAAKYKLVKPIFNVRISNQNPGSVAFELKHDMNSEPESSKLAPSLGKGISQFSLEGISFESSDLYGSVSLLLKALRSYCIYGNGNFHSDIAQQEVNNHRRGYINMLDLVMRNYDKPNVANEQIVLNAIQKLRIDNQAIDILQVEETTSKMEC